MLPGALSGLRVGCVSYLNSKPLIHGLDPAEIFLQVPAVLSQAFAAEKLDAALLPVFEIFRLRAPAIADDISISCLGEVFSVFVAARTSFADCGAIHADPSSRSSAALLRVLCAEFYHGPHVVESTPIEDAPRLIIGDPALQFRREHIDDGWHFHDLGALWLQHTGLPFVFAAWALNEKCSPGTASYLREIKSRGLASIPEIASRTSDPAAAEDYLKHKIRFDLGDREKEAMRLFARLAHKHGLLTTETIPPFI
jgi:chorismate dehydratase